jgi:hypothetical protein
MLSILENSSTTSRNLFQESKLLGLSTKKTGLLKNSNANLKIVAILVFAFSEFQLGLISDWKYWLYL